MKYPYYIVPAVEEYRRLDPESQKARKLAGLLAANIGDYASLRLILGIDPPEFARFYPDMETTTPSTMDTIDSFLDKFGGDRPDPTTLGTGFSGYVLEDEPEIDNQEREEKEEDIEVETETEKVKDILSRLIKERRYQEAIQFIEVENLNNPEKSIYFAHQIRFLKKLRSIEKFRNRNQS